MRTHRGILLAAALLTAPSVVLAQEAEEPVLHYIAISTFDVPAGDAREAAFEYIDEVWAPGARLDPNLLSFRVVSHRWGANSAQVGFIYEYADFASIDAPCEPCDAWYESERPAEGTPERQAWDEREETFFAVYSGHHDEIYTADMSRAK